MLKSLKIERFGGTSKSLKFYYCRYILSTPLKRSNANCRAIGSIFIRVYENETICTDFDTK
jgi:hypothetical protein